MKYNFTSPSNTIIRVNSWVLVPRFGRISIRYLLKSKPFFIFLLSITFLLNNLIPSTFLSFQTLNTTNKQTSALLAYMLGNLKLCPSFFWKLKWIQEKGKNVWGREAEAMMIKWMLMMTKKRQRNRGKIWWKSTFIVSSPHTKSVLWVSLLWHFYFYIWKFEIKEATVTQNVPYPFSFLFFLFSLIIKFKKNKNKIVGVNCP